MKRLKLMSMCIGLTFILAIVNTAFAHPQFPNVFRTTTPKDLNRAVSYVYDHLEFPIYSEARQRVEWVNLVDHLNQVVRPIDPSAQIFMGGIRAILGYLYEQTYRSGTLDAIYQQKTFSHLEVQGVGSDWDVFLQCKPEHFEVLRSLILREIGSVEHKMGIPKESLSEGLRKQIYPVADVKEYSSQVSKSMEQGGSELDWLAYDAERKMILEPKGAEEIIHDFLMGVYTYHVPGDPRFNTDKQIIRALRPMVEIPFLRLKNEAYVKSLVKALFLSIENGNDLSPNAIEAILRMVRNTRFAAANNRLLEADGDSVESYVRKICDYYQQRKDSILISEMVPFQMKEAEPPEPIPPELLPAVVAPDEFFEHYTDRGKLYHFTPSPDNALLIFRSGIRISNGKQGYARYGSGGYLTSDPQLNLYPYRLDVEVKRERHFLALDLERIEGTPFLAELERLHPDLNKYLREKYHAEFIFRKYVMLQNIDAIRVSHDVVFKGLLHSLYSQLQDSSLGILAQTKLYLEYELLYASYALLNKEVIQIESPEKIKSRLLEEIQRTTQSAASERETFAAEASLFALNLGAEGGMQDLGPLAASIERLFTKPSPEDRSVVNEDRAICVLVFQTLAASSRIDRGALFSFGLNLHLVLNDLDKATNDFEQYLVTLVRGLGDEEKAKHDFGAEIMSIYSRIENPFFKVYLARLRLYVARTELEKNYPLYLESFENLYRWSRLNAEGKAPGYPHSSEILNMLGAGLGSNVLKELEMIYSKQPEVALRQFRSFLEATLNSYNGMYFRNAIHSILNEGADSMMNGLADIFIGSMKLDTDLNRGRTIEILDSLQSFEALPEAIKEKILELKISLNQATYDRVVALYRMNNTLVQTKIEDLIEELLSKPTQTEDCDELLTPQ